MAAVNPPGVPSFRSHGHKPIIIKLMSPSPPPKARVPLLRNQRRYRPEHKNCIDQDCPVCLPHTFRAANSPGKAIALSGMAPLVPTPTFVTP
ncbi:hypothetical protein XM38_010710 [Halomicronema hongdechloris C2206]|uniref:Uncharacterized protein n=1 Tax=Halomicronema hongdechloris C2206 TaxID=1641165 RepID=A0A1Z3HIM0_9CYAN|nr:hypothetical protein XM38_010710 [Halomicronema hongdechloris C2206]